MKILVTGSAGHLGEGLVRTLRSRDDDAVSIDCLASPFTTHVGSITDRAFVRKAMKGVDAVLHAATLHKPHVATHSRQDFVDTNITGTLNLLEEAADAGVKAFVFTSTTSAFGNALTPEPSVPAAWITEDVPSIPKNIYGVTKTATEDLSQLVHRLRGLPVIVLRTSRFFPEEDDNKALREGYSDDNTKVNELLFRRVDIADAVDAHLLAIARAPEIGFARYVISATSPFRHEDVAELRRDAAAVLRRRVPEYEAEYARRGWRMFPSIDRVYVNDRARHELGWTPRHDFAHAIAQLKASAPFASPLSRAVGAKGYHSEAFAEGPYPVE